MATIGIKIRRGAKKESEIRAVKNKHRKKGSCNKGSGKISIAKKATDIRPVKNEH